MGGWSVCQHHASRIGKEKSHNLGVGRLTCQDSRPFHFMRDSVDHLAEVSERQDEPIRYR